MAAGAVAAVVEHERPSWVGPAWPAHDAGAPVPRRWHRGARERDVVTIRTDLLPSGLHRGHRGDGRGPLGVHRLLGGDRVAGRDRPSWPASSHFLEHLLFKGTETRSAAAIAEAVDEVGGDFNAFTTKEYTSFYIRLLAEHVDLGLDILSDIMWRPALRADDLDAERQVILDEILMHADEPADEAAEQSSAIAVSGSPARPRGPGHRVLGVGHDGRPHPGLLRRALPARQHGGRRGRRPRPRGAWWPGSTSGPASAGAGRRRRGPLPTTRVTPAGRDPAVHRAGPRGPGRPLRRPQPPEPLRPRRPQPRPRRRAVEPPLPGDPGAAGPGLLGLVRAGRLPRRRLPQRRPRHRSRARGRGARHRHRRARRAGRRRDRPSGSWPSPRATCGPRPCWPARTPAPG